MSPPAEPPERETARSRRQDAAERSSVALLHELAEALTAITSYVEAASHLHDTDPPSGRTRLRQALEKSLAQLSRADGVVRRLRTLLRDEKEAADE